MAGGGGGGEGQLWFGSEWVIVVNDRQQRGAKGAIQRLSVT